MRKKKMNDIRKKRDTVEYHFKRKLKDFDKNDYKENY